MAGLVALTGPVILSKHKDQYISVKIIIIIIIIIVVSDEEVVAGVARSHFESLGKGESEYSDEISVGEEGNDYVARVG